MSDLTLAALQLLGGLDVFLPKVLRIIGREAERDESIFYSLSIVRGQAERLESALKAEEGR